ncbi:MAG: META domain-containing protein [Bacteroidota bacterium]
MKNLFFILSLFIGLTACTPNLNSLKRTPTKWVLTEWPGKTLPGKAQATLNITEGHKIGGKSFCNVYGGNAVFNGNALKFSQFFGTKMYCEGSAEAENKFIADLEAVNAGRLSGDKLLLLKDEQVVMVFSKTE